MWRVGQQFLLIGACCVLLSTTAWAGKFNKKLSVGDAAPAWQSLKGVDQQDHALADYNAKLLVIVFTCNQCPIASGYEARLNALVRNYRDQGLQIVAINVNRGKNESLERMAKRAKVQALEFDYLKDDSQASAKDYGARTTPSVFLLNQERKIVYMGAIDDNWEAEEAVEHHYLKDAIQAVLAGKSPEVSESRAVGCGIPYGQDDE